jgi:acyl-[acyl-carrier-protein]-phospholipid O-acyltransferase/long-chain-fatty-acid--[acyl-carrier-protein] ligase
MKVYDGAAMIADKSDAMIVPVRLEGLDRTLFTRLSHLNIRRQLFPKVRVTFLPPRRLILDQTLFGRKRRQAAGAALYDIMSDLLFETTSTQGTLTSALHASIAMIGGSRIMLEDPITGVMKGRTVEIGAAVLARKIAMLGNPGDAIGLLLPNANAAAVTFFAVQQAGRVAAMLNFTAGAANIRSACTGTCITHVLTSRAFIEKADLGAVVADLAKQTTIHYLEDIRKTVTKADKLRGVLERGRPLVIRSPDDPAVVLFTSGSEGAPKGVVLSHRNILANLAQVTARIDLSPNDIVFNVLPVFHSFGLTGGLLAGMLTGMRVFLYPSPLHYRQIPELIYGTNATILFGTDTFLTGYARMANPYDFRSLRYIVAGAERVKDETRRLYMERFGQRILEAYGVTETSPALSINTPMFNKLGTVGRILPGMEHRLDPVPGIAEGGRLFVRGPNVMLGYYRADNPGELEAPPAGWHDTGDIVVMDAERFISIKGRAKRFAKIAGEMVSLTAVEQICGDLWPEHPPAVVAVPDARKGERLIMITTRSGATRAEVQAWMKGQGAAELMFPSELIMVEALPLLGSGKTDYVELDRLVRSKLGLVTVA